jgi:hypothetical protein
VGSTVEKLNCVVKVGSKAGKLRWDVRWEVKVGSEGGK